MQNVKLKYFEIQYLRPNTVAWKLSYVWAISNITP